MRFAVGILTHDMFRTGRAELFQRTLASLNGSNEDIEFYVVSNGSTDETDDYVRGLGGTILHDPISTCGHGMNATLSILAASGADVCVFSNDDIGWKRTALTKLGAFWEAAPADILIASGLQQDVYPWSTPRERIEYGGVVGLVRDSVPGGAWTLRASDWPKIRPVPEAPGWDDVPTCDRLRRKGYRVCALDLAEHLGEDLSTWGNDSARHGTPLDRGRWGLP